MGRERGAEGVSSNNESFGGFSKVGYHVKDMHLGVCSALRRCSGSCGTRAHPCCRGSVTLKELYIHFFKVNESPMVRFWEVHLERAFQLDNDWKMVGSEDRKGHHSEAKVM